jgi:class 3 adenylate cyclase
MPQKSKRMIVISFDLCRYSEITVAQTTRVKREKNPIVITNEAIHKAIVEPLKGIARDNQSLRYFIKPTGDGALVFFPEEHADVAIDYIVEFQSKAERANRKGIERGVGTEQKHDNLFRFYRIGCAVGGVSIYVVSKHSGADFAGVAIADSVRIESSGRAGEILISDDVYSLLDKSRKKKFGRKRKVAGKHDSEKYVVRTMPPGLIAPWEIRTTQKNRRKVLLRLGVLALIPVIIYEFRTPIANYLQSLP